MALPVNEALEQLSLKIDTLIAKFNPLCEKAELFGALAKAQAEMKTARSNQENRYFKTMFEDLESVIAASRPALTKYGLSVIHIPQTNEDGAAVLKCILAHSSGQFIESTMRMLPVSNDPQSLGSCFTYLRRLSYASLVGVAAQQEDDDAERAMADMRLTEEKGTSLNHKYNPKEQSSETITREQLDEIEYELAEYPDIGEQVLKGLRILSLADIPKSKYRDAVTRIRTIKAARNGVTR
jgi:hypothetical protein